MYASNPVAHLCRVHPQPGSQSEDRSWKCSLLADVSGDQLWWSHAIIDEIVMTELVFTILRTTTEYSEKITKTCLTIC